MTNHATTTTLPVLALVASLNLAQPLASAHALAPSQNPAPRAANLIFTPEAPPPGSTVAVAYQPLETLVGERQLVLRGHFRFVQRIDPGHAPRNERVAILMPGDGGSFAGSFQVPDAPAYGTFVVEDMAGERHDANRGLHFELLVHGEDRSAHADVLIQRAIHYEDRDPVIVSESHTRAAELIRAALAEQNPGDSIMVTFSDSPPGGAGDDDLEPPELPPELMWTRTFVRWREDRDAPSALEELEDEWPTAEGRRTGIAQSGLLIAVEARDLTAVDRWTDRVLHEDWADPWSDKLMVAQLISTIPERHDRALELARAALADLDTVDLAGYPGRPLGQAASDYAGVLARARADALAEFNRLSGER